METTLDLDSQLDNGKGMTLDQQPNDTEMDQSLPSPTKTSRPGSPQLSNCRRRHQLAQDIKFYTITMENKKSNINSLRLNGLVDDNSHIMKENHQRLADYTSLHQITVSLPLYLDVKSPAVQNTIPLTLHLLKVTIQISPTT
ncbi:hypothetical protein TNIN_185741 [Trichonephila inaurata madagascariensis]|uniref:Uncharacterized protein n=1 Tax=Trichonephila inaurata madagascariensis TaxID=2747483 RepID=A0A8X7BVV0_9ARAC|nr:hypothetical protein TNIN_185741 [Trichonephila inaurata madagascariensis]